MSKPDFLRNQPPLQHRAPFYAIISFFFLVLLCAAAFGQSDPSQPHIGPNGVLVHSKFGGQIFGYDIDQNGTEGVLTEDKDIGGGNVLAAVETFDQKTGKILKVVAKTQTKDNFLTLGVVGSSVGVIEHEHVKGIYVDKRTYNILNPVSGNKFDGTWTPPIGSKHIIEGVSRTQGVPNVAIYAYDNSGNFTPYVFSSDVASNKFGPIIKIKDANNFASVPPPIGYNSVTNTAILGGGNGCFGCLPVMGVANLTTGKFTEFTGIGFGFVNGIAIDSADDIACTTTEDDANVEFYDLKTQTGFTVVLPNSGSQQFFSGADVEFDAINKLFLVAQPNSSSSSSGSSIYVYDTKGNLKETLNGFSFSNSFNVIGTYIGLHPSDRTAYVNGPDQGVTELQMFTY